MKKNVTYEIDGTSYEVQIEKKRMRSSMRLTYHAQTKSFYCSYSSFVSEASLKEFLDKNVPILIKRHQKKEREQKEVDTSCTYLLGVKVSLNGESEEAFLRKRVKEIKAYFTERTRYFEKQMKIEKPYRISIRGMKSRYGSNSSATHSISYSLYLYRYDPAIIDSVVIHELVHDTHRNHGVRFYNRLYRFCPDYDKLRKRLIHNDFERKEEEE